MRTHAQVKRSAAALLTPPLAGLGLDSIGQSPADSAAHGIVTPSPAVALFVAVDPFHVPFARQVMTSRFCQGVAEWAT